MTVLRSAFFVLRCAFLALPFCVGIAAVQPAQTADPAIAIDFRAIGPDGTPLLDLKPEEVTLKVDNKIRAIKSLRLVRQDTAPSKSGLPVVPPPYVTNVIDERDRSTLVIIDDVTIKTGQERGMRDAIDKFIASLSSNDRVGLLTIPRGGVSTDVTTDHQKVRDKLATVRGQASDNETAAEAECRARDSLQALAGALDGLVGSTTPITIVLYSSKMVGPSQSARLGLSRDTGSAPRDGGIGSCVVEKLEWEKVGQAAAAARAQFYIVMPDDAAANDVKTRAGLENLAGVTGGQLAHTTSGGENSLARVLRETTSYYVATFDPDPTERNGAGHALDVRVTRPNVITRARPEVPLPPPSASMAKATAKDILHDARVYRDLPLRVASFVARNPSDDKVKVMTLFEPNTAGTALATAMVGVFDDAGRLVAQWTAQSNELNKLPVIAALAVPSGKYRVRVAATDATGRGGAADTSVDAVLAQAGGVKCSSLLLADAQNGLAFKIQFAGNASVMAYLELYGVNDPRTLSGTIELAETVDGPTVASGPAQLTGSSSMVTVTGGFGIGGLPPGDYVIRVVISMNGQVIARATHTLRKTGQP